MVKGSKKQPVNFIDLRGAKLNKSRLIQDITWPTTQNRLVKWFRKSRLSSRAVLVLIIFLLIVIAQIVNQFFHSASPIPKVIRSQINFTTFVPTNMPHDYLLQQNSYALDKSVLTYTIQAPSNQQVLVSEQKEPSNFDIDSFQHDLIKNKDTENTRYGTAYFGNIEHSQIGSLVAAGTWVFLSEPLQAGNPH